MTPFEFVFALISIITSLALTKIITGVIAIIRHKAPGSISLTHALWVWVAFAVVIGNWGVLWGARLDPNWPSLRVFAWLTAMTSLYAFCALVVPDVDGDKAVNLNEFHEHEGRRYIIAHMSLPCAVLMMRRSAAPLTRRRFSSLQSLLLRSAPRPSYRGRPQLSVVLVAILATIFRLHSTFFPADCPFPADFSG